MKKQQAAKQAFEVDYSKLKGEEKRKFIRELMEEKRKYFQGPAGKAMLTRELGK